MIQVPVDGEVGPGGPPVAGVGGDTTAAWWPGGLRRVGAGLIPVRQKVDTRWNRRTAGGLRPYLPYSVCQRQGGLVSVSSARRGNRGNEGRGLQRLLFKRRPPPFVKNSL